MSEMSTNEDQEREGGEASSDAVAARAVQCDIRGCVAGSRVTVWLDDPSETVDLCERHGSILGAPGGQV